MNTLRKTNFKEDLQEMKESLELIMDDFDDLYEIIDLLKNNKLKDAKDEIRFLDTAVRDYCVEYFDEDMLNKVDMEGRGKVTGRHVNTKELALAVVKGIMLYLNVFLAASAKDAKDFLDAQKAKSS